MATACLPLHRLQLFRLHLRLVHLRAQALARRLLAVALRLYLGHQHRRRVSAKHPRRQLRGNPVLHVKGVSEQRKLVRALGLTRGRTSVIFPASPEYLLSCISCASFVFGTHSLWLGVVRILSSFRVQPELDSVCDSREQSSSGEHLV